MWITARQPGQSIRGIAAASAIPALPNQDVEPAEPLDGGGDEPLEVCQVGNL